ncbi:MAG TPA: thiamine-phosphate kinase [Stellaceae bacterium]|nr:thiamine-phosphate kinase [Stellaceae bacterium]
MTIPAAPPPLGEFERIARFFAPLAAPGALGLRDDIALIDGPAGEQYALTTDAIVAGVDYFPDDPPFMIAQKLLRVNLSDLAAKGAVPFGYLLTTALPESCGESWLAEFSAGLAADQKQFGLALLGGDSSAIPGPALLSATLIGRVARGTAILRSGARDGDWVYVSGTLGDAALGLAVRKGEVASGLDPAARDYLVERYRLPRPRVTLGQRLVGIAHAMIDISDGLVADLGHLCAASKLGAIVREPDIPLSPAARAALVANPRLNAAVTGGGDDYELLFSAPAAAADAIAQAAGACGVAIAAIGAMGQGEGVTLLDAAGQPITVEHAGYAHF